VVVGALLLAGLWFLLISPKREEALQLGEQVTEAQGMLDQARSDLARFEQARAAYRDNYAVLAAVGKAAPAEDATATLLFQIGATARSEKVDFRSFAAGQAPAGAPAAEATQALPAEPFSFDYAGPFFRLSDFLGGLQRYVDMEGERLAVDGRLLHDDVLGGGGGGAPSGGGGAPSGGGGGGAPSGGGQANPVDTGPVEAPEPAARREPDRTFTMWEVDTRVFRDGTQVRGIGDIAPLTPLPTADRPAALFLGVFNGGSSAGFVIHRFVDVRGSNCQARPERDCSLLRLGEGSNATLSVEEDGREIAYQIIVDDIRKVTTRDERRATRHRERRSSFGSCLLKTVGQDYGAVLFDPAQGTWSAGGDVEDCAKP